MKKVLLVFACLLQASVLIGDGRLYVGPHINYTRLDFNNPSDLEGYMGGVTVGGEYECWCLFTSVDFEGYWNSGPVVGRPCERSSLTEYFVEWKVGGNFWPCGSCFQIKPYAGFGYNRFENDQEPHGIGLEYDYDKLFVPLGFYAFWSFAPCSKLGVQFEWRPDVYSCLDVATLSFSPDLENAFRLQLPLVVYFDWCCHCLDLQIIPFFDWNRFGKVDDDSPDHVMVDIPELTRWNLGLRVLLGYNF